MKLTIISDTHLDHEKLGVMSGEVLIHCGDIFELYGNSEAPLTLLWSCSCQPWCVGKRGHDLYQCVYG